LKLKEIKNEKFLQNPLHHNLWGYSHRITPLMGLKLTLGEDAAMARSVGSEARLSVP
jgi:hypothetical protein